MLGGILLILCFMYSIMYTCGDSCTYVHVPYCMNPHVTCGDSCTCPVLYASTRYMGIYLHRPSLGVFECLFICMKLCHLFYLRISKISMKR